MRRICLTLLCVSTAAGAQVSGPLVSMPAAHAVSRPISELALEGSAERYAAPRFRTQRSHAIAKRVDGRAGELEPLVGVSVSSVYGQTATYQPADSPIGTHFEALGVGTPGFTITGAPPDTTLGVSDTQIVQWVNSQLAVYDKSGTALLAPPGFVNGNVIWSSLPPGSLCKDYNRGDPLVQYDRMAERWVLSQFAFNAGFSANAQCIAVSTTSNALGSYAIYEYSFGNALPDYGKLGIWPDAYYLTYNMFTTGSSFAGGRACAYDRDAMLDGLAATQICFNSTNRFSFLPADFDGEILPPPGTPNYHVSWDWVFTLSPYSIQITKFVPDFVTPGNSTFNDGFGGATFSFVDIDLASTTLGTCNDNTGNCVPQLGTVNTLDTLGDRPMYRNVYRNFGSHDALLFTQAIDTETGSTASLRWTEIRNPGANPPAVHQISTFKPTADARWMGSGAFDRLGNIAIGYSASSSSINPAIRLAGRRKTDPKNLLRGETIIHSGTGSQTGTLQRWGDYSTMQIDPADDCTFWYTTQYIGANGTFNWGTRIASYKFPNCE